MKNDWNEALDFARAFYEKKKKKAELSRAESIAHYASKLSGDTVRFGTNKTLNLNEESAAAIVAELRRRFPSIR